MVLMGKSRFRLRAAIMLLAILGGAIIVGSGREVMGKVERVQEPRPFVVWLENAPYSRR